MRALLLLPLLLMALVGCDSKIPDPNDPAEVGLMQPEVLMRNLKWASEAANERVAKREITREEAKDMISKYADKLLQSVKVKEIDEKKAWEYAEVFRTAKRWSEAEGMFRTAVKNASSGDRRVNDTLRLAHVLAEQDKVDEALTTARSVFDEDPKDTAPILLSVYLEIAPASRGKGRDEEVAKLIDDAVDIHNNTIVDPRVKSGQDFMATKAYHVNKASRLAAELYRAAGKPELAEKLFERIRLLGTGGARA